MQSSSNTNDDLPQPNSQNFGNALEILRRLQPSGAYASGIAIQATERQTYWSVNYSVNNDEFPQPTPSNIQLARSSFQSNAPRNSRMHQVRVVTIPTLESKWQVEYTVTSVLAKNKPVKKTIKINKSKINHGLFNYTLSFRSTNNVNSKDNGNKSSLTQKENGKTVPSIVMKTKSLKCDKVETEQKAELCYGTPPIRKRKTPVFKSEGHRNYHFCRMRHLLKNKTQDRPITFVPASQDNKHAESPSIPKNNSIIEHPSARTTYAAIPPPINLKYRKELECFSRAGIDALYSLSNIATCSGIMNHQIIASTDVLLKLGFKPEKNFNYMEFIEILKTNMNIKHLPTCTTSLNKPLHTALVTSNLENHLLCSH